MRTDVAPRVEYGRTEPHLRRFEGGVEARGGPVRLTCSAPLDMHLDNGVIRSVFTMEPERMVDLALHHTPSFSPNNTATAGKPSIEQTLAAWESWSVLHTSYDGAFPEQVRRSSLVLQGLTFGPSGAIVAGATTSLPETMGGELNFDYRCAWLRDLS